MCKIINGINDLDADHTHSFEYAHFVMLFVGVLQCVQTTWACYCNREIKKQVWIGCNSVWGLKLKETYDKQRNHCFWCFSATYHYIQLQLFKICFHDVFDLPKDFSFAHYFSMSLDSHTVELVDVLPSSYGAVLFIVCVSEFVVRFQGPSEHDLDLWKVDSNGSVIIFVVLGVAISAVYVYLYLVTAKSLMNVLVVKFGCEGYRSVGRTLELRLNEQQFGNRAGGRGLNEVITEMRPFMDKGYFEGIETVETLQPTSAVTPTTPATGATAGSPSFLRSTSAVSTTGSPNFLRSTSAVSTTGSTSFGLALSVPPTPIAEDTSPQLSPALAAPSPKFLLPPLMNPTSLPRRSRSKVVPEQQAEEKSPERVVTFGGEVLAKQDSAAAELAKQDSAALSELDKQESSASDVSDDKSEKTDKSENSNGSKNEGYDNGHAGAKFKTIKGRRASVAAKAFRVTSTANLGSRAIGGRRASQTFWQPPNMDSSSGGSNFTSAAFAVFKRTISNAGSDKGSDKDEPDSAKSLPRQSSGLGRLSMLEGASSPKYERSSKTHALSQSKSFSLSKSMSRSLSAVSANSQSEENMDLFGGAATAAAKKAKKSRHGSKTSRMVGLAGVHSKQKRNTIVMSKLESSHLEADAVIECVREALPFGSLGFLRKAVDATRFVSAFYLSVWLTTFLPIFWTTDEDFGMHLSPAVRLLAEICWVPLLLTFVVMEPIVLFQYSMISTISCVNPLLLGETLEFCNEQHKMIEFLAFRILNRYMSLTDLNLDEQDVENIAAMKELLVSIFDDWDLHQVGYIDQPTFVHVMHSLGLHFTTHQMGCLFRRIDPDLSGMITFDEFWDTLVGPLSEAMRLLQSHFAPSAPDEEVEDDDDEGEDDDAEDEDDDEGEDDDAEDDAEDDAVDNGVEEEKEEQSACPPPAEPPFPPKKVSPTSSLHAANFFPVRESSSKALSDGSSADPALDSSSAPPVSEPALECSAIASPDGGTSSMSSNGAKRQERFSALLAGGGSSDGSKNEIRGGKLPPLEKRPSTRNSGPLDASDSGRSASGKSRQRRQTLTPSGSGMVLDAVGAYPTVEDFFKHMTPSAPSGGGHS
eukprot:CAMPEP_0171869632 /NCGR_PEP_ID=MMETSP0992-20121227/32130_1 /TAXON_ID=483369 /ORGANISM="non described non described, Strain CCMP2098" /LENGTH=1090 /DNA_ID=CAMNT_0012493555 /DNA_START=102 /DNA_END=3375 /DNA_ORIENTATION=-